MYLCTDYNIMFIIWLMSANYWVRLSIDMSMGRPYMFFHTVYLSWTNITILLCSRHIIDNSRQYVIVQA